MLSMQQHPRASTSTLPPFSHYQPQSSSSPSRPRLVRKDSPTLPPTLHRSPSNGSSSPHLLSLLHPERNPITAPIPRRLQTSPLILCEASPFHKRSRSPPSPASRMTPLPELEEEGGGRKSTGKCQGRTAEEMKVLADGWLFPREEVTGRKHD